MMGRIERVKELLGLNKNTEKEDLKDRHQEIIEEIEGDREDE